MSKLRDASAVAKATGCKVADVKKYLPGILKALEDRKILKTNVVIAVIATVATECSFKPVTEYGNKAYFEKYEFRKTLGNTQDGDGYKYRGRGFIQITGRHNYTYYGNALGYDLVNNPDKALEPEVAAAILALYFVERKVYFSALNEDWSEVRRKVNGGYNGLDRFMACVNKLKPLALED